jgi:hypothetical protein
VSIQLLVAVTLCRWPCRVQVVPTCTRHGHRQLPEVVLTQFVSPDDEHDVLETCRELKTKINTYKRTVRHVGHLPRIMILYLYVRHYANKKDRKNTTIISNIALYIIGFYQKPR